MDEFTFVMSCHDLPLALPLPCQIRKKKCDNIRPACSTCTFRKITCHGYGMRPHLMDDAENQKVEIEKIKLAMKQSFKSRRALPFSRIPRHEFRAATAAQNIRVPEMKRIQNS